jgi:hypothetical protein
MFPIPFFGPSSYCSFPRVLQSYSEPFVNEKTFKFDTLMKKKRDNWLYALVGAVLAQWEYWWLLWE